MDWLKQWVRDLATLVLLAGTVEMLVPMGGLKKYVRMVMGLLVMVSILNPVLALWEAEVHLDEALLQNERSSLPSMNQIESDANRYRARIRSQVSEQFQKQVEAQAAQIAQTQDGVGAASAAAEIVHAKDGGLQVQRLQVHIRPGQSDQAVVKPVEPVRIGQTERADEPAPAQTRLAEQVRRSVAAGLGLDPRHVTVTVKEAP